MKSSVNQTHSTAPSFILQPRITTNPNPRVPLAAILSFVPDREVQTHVKVNDGDRQWEINFGRKSDPAKGLPLFGFRPGRRHTFSVSIGREASGFTTFEDILTWDSPSLPTNDIDFPFIRVNQRKADKLEPGILLLSVRRGTCNRNIWRTEKEWEFTRNWGMLLALDKEGEVIWYYLSDTRIAGFDMLENGNLLMHTAGFVVYEIDMLGNTINLWYASQRPQGQVSNAIPVEVQTLHHQPTVMPSGNFLSFTANAREIENFYTSEHDPKAPRKKAMVMGDTIIEFDRNGKILWSWNAFEHLDIYRIGYDTFSAFWHVRGFPGHWDWTHCNGLHYDENEDAVIACFRNQDAIIKIDRVTGEIRWILGDTTGWNKKLAAKLLKPAGDVDFAYHPHNPRITDSGTIILLDNGILKARPFDPPVPPDQTFSRAVEYEIDEEKMTVKQVWASEKKLSDDSINDWAMGDAHRLKKTDNILAIYALCVPRLPNLSYDVFDTTRRNVDDMAHGALIREYARSTPPEILLEIDVCDRYDLLQWEVYGGLHLPGIYPDQPYIFDNLNILSK